MPRVPEALLPLLLASSMLPGCSEPPKPAPLNPNTPISSSTTVSSDLKRYYPEIAHLQPVKSESLRTSKRDLVRWHNYDRGWNIDPTALQITHLSMTNLSPYVGEVPFLNRTLRVLPTQPSTVDLFITRPEHPKPSWNPNLAGLEPISSVRDSSNVLAQITPDEPFTAGGITDRIASANLQAYTVICRNTFNISNPNTVYDPEAANVFCISVGYLFLYRNASDYVNYERDLNNSAIRLQDGKLIEPLKFRADVFSSIPQIPAILSPR